MKFMIATKKTKNKSQIIKPLLSGKWHSQTERDRWFSDWLINDDKMLKEQMRLCVFVWLPSAAAAAAAATARTNGIDCKAAAEEGINTYVSIYR